MKPIPVRQIKSARFPANTGIFSIRSLEQVMNGNEMAHELHRHDFYFVLALQQGAGTHEIDFTPYLVHDQSLFILRPGQVHRLELKAGASGFLLEFDKTFYRNYSRLPEDLWKKALGKTYCETGIGPFQKLYAYLVRLFEEHTTREDGYREAMSAYLDLFVIEYNRQSRHQLAAARSGSTYAQERFEELVLLLEADISQVKSASDYAQKLNLSLYQLNAITKSAVGKTVSELINEQILLEAKRYLLATSSQVKDIAGLLGYEDPSYFIRFFRKHIGLSPETFRKNFK